MFQSVFKDNKNGWRLLGLLAFMSLTSAVWAGPPFETDDPEPPEPGHWEIYLGATALQVRPLSLN
jgi:hypothetical protein